MAKRLIRLTEQQLVQLIEDGTKKLLNEFYALERRDYMSKFQHYIPIIVAHWAILYYSRTAQRSLCHKHWCDELEAFFESQSSHEIKGGNKFKAATQAFYAFVEKNTNMLKSKIKDKFQKENITAYNIDEIFKAFMEDAPHVIEAGINASKAQEYIQNRFG